MKKAALLLALTLFCSTAQAEDIIPPYNACSVWLGEAVQINGLFYIPVMVENDYLVDIRSVFGWGDYVPDLELTGTVHPINPNASLQGHLNGNYWPYTYTEVRHAQQPYNPGFGDWKLAIGGYWALPAGGEADCASLPYPGQTSGVLCYLHFAGTGTVRLTASRMFSGDACDFPGITYHGYNVGTNAVQFPIPDPPPCLDCGGGDDPILHLTTGGEVPKPLKRTTWGSIKKFYR